MPNESKTLESGSNTTPPKVGAIKTPSELPKHLIFSNWPRPTVTGQGMKNIYSISEKIVWSKTVTLCLPH